MVIETGLTEGTVMKHLETLNRSGKLNSENTAHLGKGMEWEMIELNKAFADIGTDKLSPIYDRFDGCMSYDIIRLARILYEAGRRD
jgi:hypothetical protein